MTSISKQQLGLASVLVVGDAMLDRYWHGAVDRISPEAPVPVVELEHESFMPGGAGNVARNLRALVSAVKGRQIGFVTRSNRTLNSISSMTIPSLNSPN